MENNLLHSNIHHGNIHNVRNLEVESLNNC